MTTWLSTVFGFLVIIGLLDSLANGDKLLSGDGGIKDTFTYMMYRAPVIFDRIFIFSLIVAALLVYVRLIRNHELVALLGFGFSVPKQIAMLAPVMLFCALASVIFINLAMPPAVRALQAWGIGEYKDLAISQESPLWIEDNGKIVMAQGRPGMNDLSDLVIFTLDENGTVQSETHAAWATYDGNGGWALKKEVSVLQIAGANGDARKAAPADNLRWETTQTPATIARLAAEPRDLSLSDLDRFSQKGNSGSKPQFAYGFWYWHRLTRPLTALLLLACAVPLMQRTGREDTGEKALLIGLALGFLFLIIDGAMATFATSGNMAIATAITIPIVLLALISSYLVLKTETLTLKRS